MDNVTMTVSEEAAITLAASESGEDTSTNVEENIQYSMPGDYGKLSNKPAVNSVELAGNKTSEDLGINKLSNTDIQEVLNA